MNGQMLFLSICNDYTNIQKVGEKMTEKNETPYFYDTVIDLTENNDESSAVNVEIKVRESHKEGDVAGEIDRITKIKAYSVNEAIKAYLHENPSLTREELTVSY